jgi:hypothetical protein
MMLDTMPHYPGMTTTVFRPAAHKNGDNHGKLSQLWRQLSLPVDWKKHTG